MNNFDEIKFSIPKRYMKWYDKEVVDKNIFIVDRIKKKYRIHGIKEIRIRENQNDILFHFTSKVLEDNYPQLINFFSLQKIIKLFSSFIKIDKIGLLFKSSVYLCHVTTDLILTQDIQKYLGFLSIYPHSAKFYYKYYRNGIYYFPLAFTDSSVFKIYNKSMEVRKFPKKHPSNIKIRSNRILRLEYELFSLAKIRKEFALQKGDIPLIKLLRCKRNIILEMFKKVFPALKVESKILKGYQSTKTLNEFKKKLAHITILKTCDYNLDRVLIMLKGKNVKGNLSAQKKDFKNLINDYYVNKEGNRLFLYNEIFDSLMKTSWKDNCE